MIKYNFLLPAYKPNYFKLALDSILNQTYTDFKLIILNDCSPYDIKAIVDEFDDKRIVYQRNEVNLGGNNLVDCWNKLLSLADSEYVILASDDDVYEYNFLETIDSLSNKYPKADLLRARVRAIDEEGKMIEKDALYEEYVDCLDFLKQKHYDSALRCIANYVFRLDTLRSNGGFISFPLAWYSDDATVMMMAENGVVNTNDMLFNFRSSSVNISCRKLSHTDAYKKAMATIFFDDWFKSHIPSMMEKYKDGKNAEYIRRIKRFVNHNHDSFMHEMFSYFSSNCTFKEFRDLLTHIANKRKRYRLMYNYLRAQMKK